MNLAKCKVGFIVSKKHIARKVVSAGLCAVLVGSGVAVSSVSYVAGGGMPSALASTPDENTPITFKDANLKQALFARLSELRYVDPLDDSHTITIGAALKVKGYDLNTTGTAETLIGKKIQNIDGMQYFTNAPQINFSTNQIKDITPLKKLTKLQGLYLNQNSLRSVDALADLTNLTTLFCSDNQIEDISSLSNLKNLKSLWMANNRLSLFDVVKNFKNLNNLRIENNNIADISALKDFPDMKFLGIGGNPITDFSALQKLNKLIMLYVDNTTFSDNDWKFITSTDLAILHVGGTKITTLEPMKNFTKLSRVWIDNNQSITDFSPLNSFTNLVELNVNNTKFSDANTNIITNNPKLTLLKVGGTGITNLDFLSKTPNITSLDISNNKNISNFEKLKSMSKLVEFDTSNTKIDDGTIAAIVKNHYHEGGSTADLSSIKKLNLSGTDISNLDFLQYTPNVTSLDISNCQKITDFVPIRFLKKIEKLNITNNHIPEDQIKQIMDSIKELDVPTPIDINITSKDKNVDLSKYVEEFGDPISSECTNNDSVSYDSASKQGQIKRGGARATFHFKKNKAFINVVVDFLEQKTEKPQVVPGKDESTDPDADITAQSAALEALFKNADDIKKTDNYKQADDNLKSAYDQAITDGKAIYDKLSSTPEQVKAAAEAITNALSALNGDANVKKAKDDLQTKLTAAQQSISDLQGKLQTAQQQAAAAQAKINELNQNITTLNGQITTLNQQAEALKTSNTQKQTKIGELSAQVNQLTEQVAQLTTDKQGLQNQLTAAQTSVRDLTTKLDTANGKVQTLTNDLNTAQQQARVDQATIAQTQQKVTELTQQLSAATTEKQQLVADNTQKQAIITELTGNITSLNDKIAALQTEIANLKKAQVTPPSGSHNEGGGNIGQGTASNHAIQSLKRVWGITAYDTMRTINSIAFPDSSQYAVLTTGESYWDALSASGLAGKLQAPVLLTQGASLSEQTRLELVRLGVQKVYICGGVNAISKSVEDELAALGIAVERVAGAWASDTANEVAQHLEQTDEAFLATSWGYEDALSVAPYNYATKKPLFLTDYTTGLLDENTLAAMKAQGITRIHIVGGTSVVPQAVEDQLREQGIQIDRIAGETAYDTSIALADFLLTKGMHANNVGVATGWGFADALSGAALCGKNNSILLLADASNVRAVKDVIEPHKSDITNAYIFGGEKVVASTVYEAISEL